jgi:hypothetical protein
MSEPQVVNKLHTYNRDEMAERGRRGGLRKGENARLHRPTASVVLTGAELSTLNEAYRLLGSIAAKAKPSTDD